MKPVVLAGISLLPIALLSDGLSWDAIAALVVVAGSIATPLVAIYAILLRQNGKVGQILGRLEGIIGVQTELQNEAKANLLEHERIHSRLDDHERRIRDLEA